MGVAIADHPVLSQFLVLNLLKSRHESTMRDLEQWYWFCRGDNEAIDWGNPASILLFGDLFNVVLDSHPIIREGWDRSGMAPVDVLNWRLLPEEEQPEEQAPEAAQ